MGRRSRQLSHDGSADPGLQNESFLYLGRYASGQLDASLAEVEQALTELGYVVVPEELLTSDYDGPTAMGSQRTF